MRDIGYILMVILIILLILSFGSELRSKGKDFVVNYGQQVVIMNRNHSLRIIDTSTIVFDNREIHTRFIDKDIMRKFSFFNSVQTFRQISISKFLSAINRLQPFIDTKNDKVNFLFVNLDSLPKTEWLFHAWYIIGKCGTVSNTCLTYLKDLLIYLTTGENPLDKKK